MVSHSVARRLILQYLSAWEDQSVEQIRTLFTVDAHYHEYLFSAPLVGVVAIEQYWFEKVVSEQRDITTALKNVFVDGDTIIAEFVAYAYSIVKNKELRLQSICVCTVSGEKLSSYREYWHSAWR